MSVQEDVLANEIYVLAVSAFRYVMESIGKAQGVWVAFVAAVNYLIFPTEAYVPAVLALVITLVLDIITKYYALGVQNGGLRNAVKTRAVSSESLWIGTRRKILSYLVIFILSGLSVRVTMLTQVAVFLSTVAYSILFLREAQSVVENLIDAGHDDLGWLLFWLRRKQTQVLEEADISPPPLSDTPMEVRGGDFI